MVAKAVNQSINRKVEKFKNKNSYGNRLFIAIGIRPLLKKMPILSIVIKLNLLLKLKKIKRYA